MENKIREQIIKMVKDNYSVNIVYGIELPLAIQNKIIESYSKDGVDIREIKHFMNNCIREAKEKYIDLHKIQEYVNKNLDKMFADRCRGANDDKHLFIESKLRLIEKNLSINVDFKTKNICVNGIPNILPSEAISRICEMIQHDVEYLIFTINTPLSEISNFSFIRKNKEIIAIIENVYDGIYCNDKKKDIDEMGNIEASKIVNKNTCAILPTASFINSILKKLISSNCGVHVSYNDDINDMIVILDYVSMMEFGLDVNEFDLSTGVIKEAIKRTIIQSGDTDSISGNYNIDLKNVFNMVEQVYSEMVSNMKKVNFN